MQNLAIIHIKGDRYQLSRMGAKGKSFVLRVPVGSSVPVLP